MMRVTAELWIGLFNEQEYAEGAHYRGSVYDATTHAFLLGGQAQDELVKRWSKRHPEGGTMFSGYAPESECYESHELYGADSRVNRHSAVTRKEGGKVTTTFDFGDGPVPAHRHPNGRGWVANTATVADTAYVGFYAAVYENAHVYGNARVHGDARVHGWARVHGDAWVYGHARVYGDAEVAGRARVSGDAEVAGDACVYGDAEVAGDAQVYGYASVSENARVCGWARVGQDCVSGDTRVF